MKHPDLITTGKLLLGASLGFSFFWFTSHPKSKLKKSIPTKTYKNFSILPSIKISHKDNFYHLHHWLTLSVFYIPFIKYKGVRKSTILHGLFLGSIIQGLIYKDRFRFKYSKEGVL